MEGTILEVEDGAIIAVQDGEDLFLLVQILAGATIYISHHITCCTHKYVLLTTMTMYVAVEHEVSLLLDLLDQLFGMVDGGVQLLGWVDPLAVEVHTSQVASVVAIHNTIDIQHRDDLEDEVLPQDTCLRRITCQEVYDVLHHVAGHGLARVHPRCYHDTLLLLAVVEVTNYEEVTSIMYRIECVRVACYGLT